MFDWLTPIEKPNFDTMPRDGILHFERKTDSAEMSDVFHLFASVEVIFGTETLTAIPIPNKFVLETVMTDFVPHYNIVQKIFIDNQLTTIQFRELKKESKKRLTKILQHQKNPLVADLYRTNNMDYPTKPRKLTYYLVHPQHLSPLNRPSTKKLTEFLQHSFLTDEGVISFSPTGWKLEENLRDSTALQLFSTFAGRLILLVDEEKNIVTLDVYKNKF